MSAHTLEQEAQAHMALARLLRKDRPPARQEAVQKILDSDLSTATKIAKIQKLDGESERSSARAEEPDDLHAASQGWQPLRFSLGKLKNIIKLPHASSSFLSFVFVEHRKIKEFGRKTHIFAPTFLLPMLRLDGSVPAFLSESLQTWAGRLADLLEPAIETGWQVLTKRDYNMIVTMKKLCDEIGSLNFKILNFRDRYLIDKLRNIEALFFVFHYRHGHAERLVENVSHALLADGEHDEEAEEADLLVKSILFEGLSIPSFYDLILGLNMMKFRRLLGYTELIAADLGELFNTSRFICDPKVKQRIDGSVDNLRRTILSLHDQRTHLKRVRSYLSIREDGQLEDSLLEGFYEFEESRFEGAYRRDRENIVRFVPQFLRKLDVAFSPLLIGKIRVEKYGPVAIFGPQVFLPEVDRFRRLGFKLEQLSFGYRVFSYTRYLAIRKEGKGTIAVEAEIIRFLQDVLTDLTALGKKLAEILSRAAAVASEETGAAVIDELAVKRGSYVLPYGDEAIVSRGYLRGRTVGQALGELVTFCFLLSAYLYDREISELKETEAALEKKVDSQLRLFERLAEEGDYQNVILEVLGRSDGSAQAATPPPGATGPGEPPR